MDDQLQRYIDVVKENSLTMNEPDYAGREQDLLRQKEDLEKLEHNLKMKTRSSESFDKLVDAAVGYANKDISQTQLDEIYKQNTK
ncbi:YnfE family protein [Metabacillus litoralis]|uniref:YnfE family protein n=1 Tax=Metabacillus litoralis TaxID=152268 RepID=UPI001CFE7E2B|nr:YnfE family protein [Metabacillus litoralis]